MNFTYSIFRNHGAIFGFSIIVLVILFAIFAPLLYPGSPWKMVAQPFMPPFERADLLLGTDTLGRDVAAGLVYGARVSLAIGAISTLVALVIGVPLGAISGYAGGVIDDIFMRFTELFQTIPAFALSIVMVAILQPKMGSIVLAIGVVSWPPIARLVRGEVLSLRTREYVQAAITTGHSNASIIFNHILPNTIASIIVMGSLMIGSAILLESSLSFLGLGDPNMMSWGYMVGAGRTRIVDAWWISFFPGLAIFVTVLALNLVGEGINDAFNPALARERKG